jgi:hypothetical protein
MNPFPRWFHNLPHGQDDAKLDFGDDDRGTSVEPLTELLHLLRANGALPGHEGVSQLPIGEPLSVPMSTWWHERRQELPSGPNRPGVLPARKLEQSFRPANRPPAPLLTILDDGAATMGETVRLREPVCLIGRTDGTIRIPHDPLVSSRHAEIVRSGTQQPCTWHLRDVGSTNGTFVCSKRSPLRPDRIVILGSRRFRLHLPGAGLASISPEHTLPVSAAAGLSGWPMLVETTAPANPLCIRLVGSRLSVGRPGFGNQIELDDPLLANVHAVITQTEDGTWWIQATPSLNGVWVQVRSVELTDSCRFQCGEQRFLFMLP